MARPVIGHRIHPDDPDYTCEGHVHALILFPLPKSQKDICQSRRPGTGLVVALPRENLAAPGAEAVARCHGEDKFVVSMMQMEMLNMPLILHFVRGSVMEV
ncbi:hypothetical protein ABVT39_014883 [Epinephelus coioides]